MQTSRRSCLHHARSTAINGAMTKRTTLIVLALVVGTAALLVWMPARSSPAEEKFVQPAVGVELATVKPSAPTEVAEPALAAEPEPNQLLVQYLEDSMLKWVPLPDCTEAPTKCEAWERVERETVDHVRDRFHSIANDVAQAAMVEDSAFQNDTLNAHMAELVLSLAFMESRFREYVDDGRCNDFDWQEKTEEGRHLTGIGGTCDGSRRLRMILATSMWQIHADQGIVLLDAKKTGRESMNLWNGEQVNSEEIQKLIEADSKLPKGFGNFATKETIRGTDNRLLAARTAWHLIHGALRASKFVNICAYTGEWGDECPKSFKRLEFARKWWEKHPFTLPQE